MNLLHRISDYLLLLAITSGIGLGMPELEAIRASSGYAIAQTSETSCPAPALSRLTRHRVASGETLVSLAQRYSLIPATLMGLNPALRGGTAPVGTEILVPPYNGIRVEVPQGNTWRDLARIYRIRADVIFEANGCQNVPRIAFIPGINWSPNAPTTAATASPAASTPTANSVLSTYPLPATASVLKGYGWQVDSASQAVVFNSGVELAVETGTAVRAAGGGTVAFAGTQGGYGNLVVINHPQGLQTRYAQLDSFTVQVGQVVRAGDRIGTTGRSSSTQLPYLQFEIRTNSSLGWVAQDPSAYFRTMRVGQ